MNIRQLEYFIKIAEAGSITSAAHELYVSQPSLTKSVAMLEEEYNLTLFTRSRKGIELTKEGQNFLYYARSVIASVNKLNENTLKTAAGQHSQLFLSCIHLDFIYDLVLQCYRNNEEKHIHYCIEEANREDVTQKVLNGKAKLGLLVENIGDGHSLPWIKHKEQLSIAELDTGYSLACVGPLSPFYNKKSLTYAEASSVPNIAIDLDENSSQSMIYDTANSFFNPEKMIFANSVPMTHHLLLNTNVLLFVSPWAVNCFNDIRLRMIPFEKDTAFDMNNRLLLLKRKNTQLSSGERHFLTLLETHFSRDLSDF